MPLLTSPAIRPTRRHFLTGTAALAGIVAVSTRAAEIPSNRADYIDVRENGTLQIFALTDRAFRVRFSPGTSPLTAAPDRILLPQKQRPRVRTQAVDGKVRLRLTGIICDIDPMDGRLSFLDREGNTLLGEQPGGRRIEASKLGKEDVFIAEQAFDSPPGERIFGTGCFQDGALDVRQLPRRLTQVNTQISLPFLLSSRGYGLMWLNEGRSDLNPPAMRVQLDRVDTEKQRQVVDVTTGAGNAQLTRTEAEFRGEIHIDAPGRYAFQLDIGRKMASRHYVEIDGKVYSDLANLWLPPTTSFLAELEPGVHTLTVRANADDSPFIAYDKAEDRTVWRSDVAEAIDYVVIAGPNAPEIMADYRQLTGAAPILPKWAYGYIHCRERFKSAQEILDTAHEFRRRQLPVDVMVQDWQYWGKHGWNAMRFDETQYPDPAGLVAALHGLDMRFMLSVWSKVDRKAELGKAMASKGFYIPDSDWIDFFNPAAAAFYWQNQSTQLAALGIDAWWQDATEPENDDLVGRQTHAGKGEHVRLSYPLQVSRTVYEGQRRDFPDRRVFILTRSAFPGQQRYGAATWSGDIGNDWETLKRQIPAGLNMAAAGYPYWTVDAGGFFRPGPSQYTDSTYHERFIRWFQYATFLPLLRVHGYMTDTEFWRYGETVESISRAFLELRYRLLPYTYSLAAESNRKGLPIIRPLVFDFGHDPKALDETHTYMFGPALHVAPVLKPDVTRWEVYLPQSAGGWVDAWSGEKREGGRSHEVDAPLSQLPLHLKAGAIIPLGPVIQSTADIRRETLDLLVCPGQDGTFTLYEDDGLTYSYEQNASSRIEISWDNARQRLRIGARQGQFKGMPAARQFNIHLVGRGNTLAAVSEGRLIAYHGRAITVDLA